MAINLRSKRTIISTIVLFMGIGIGILIYLKTYHNNYRPISIIHIKLLEQRKNKIGECKYINLSIDCTQIDSPPQAVLDSIIFAGFPSSTIAGYNCESTICLDNDEGSFAIFDRDGQILPNRFKFTDISIVRFSNERYMLVGYWKPFSITYYTCIIEFGFNDVIDAVNYCQSISKGFENDYHKINS
ncbi:hypothetical protein L6Q21_14170 [Sandaracinobacter sp. RS1-74]|uniref:hypothetical protein n=1 Tax=Sandaracinobacteroides sayramensis TaxID=2913411 RepID=UPI001EDB894A|nr:hypothetical protein [Sandaracinobacteroides sayramensis]MCG2842131.1 hypothetical protein [Sandaracinobacteroides sayramensis]